jgi:NAD-dependent DNA ligase
MTNLKGLQVAVTGDFKKALGPAYDRRGMEAWLKSQGAIFVKSVTSTTNLLLVGWLRRNEQSEKEMEAVRFKVRTAGPDFIQSIIGDKIA